MANERDRAKAFGRQQHGLAKEIPYYKLLSRRVGTTQQRRRPPSQGRLIMAALTRETVLRFLVLVIFVVVSSVSVVYLTLHHATADEVYDFVILGGPRRPRSQP